MFAARNISQGVKHENDYRNNYNCYVNFVYLLFSKTSLLVLYGCETWSLTLREKHRLKIFENRLLRRIFGPKSEEDGSWRKLYNDELHSLYSSPNIVTVIKSRRMRWAGHVARMGEVFTVFWLGGPEVRYHWEDLRVGGRITLSWILGR
jgi:hypothetical protein